MNKLQYIIFLFLIFKGLLTMGSDNLSIDQMINQKQDTFSYRKIVIENSLFSEALNALKDSMYYAMKCDQFDYIRVLYKESNQTVGLVPKQIGNLIFEYKLQRMIKDSINNFVGSPVFLLFEIDGKIFQVNKNDIDKLEIEYKLLKSSFLFDKHKWENIKSERCNTCNKRTYIKVRPFITFTIDDGQINNLDFKTKEGKSLNVMWHDL